MTEETTAPTELDHSALEPPLEPHISYSQLDTFNRCSMRWYYKYVEKRPDRGSIHLVRGKAGHAAIERDQRRKISTGRNIPREELLDTFSDAYEAFLDEAGDDIKTTDDPGKDKDNTIHTLTDYSIRIAPKMQPRAVELAFNLSIPPNEIYPKPLKLVYGRLDSIEATGIYDNKFPAKREAKSQHEADMSWQLSIYDDALYTNVGVEVPNLGYLNFLPPSPKGNEPAIVSVTRRSSDAMTPEARAAKRERARNVIRSIHAQIDAGIFRPVDTPMQCRYCPYTDVCQSDTANTIRRQARP